MRLECSRESCREREAKIGTLTNFLGKEFGSGGDGLDFKKGTLC